MGILQNALDLRPVDKVSVDFRVVKRFDPEHIPRSKQLLLLRIPDDKGKHSAQPVQHPGSVFAVSLKEHLRVRIGSESVSLDLQDLPEFPIIVYLSVKRDHQFPVLCLHGLVSALQINDRETPESHGDPLIQVFARSVRSPMDDPVHHIGQDRITIDIVSGKSAYSTHNRITSCLAVSPSIRRLCGL